MNGKTWRISLCVAALEYGEDAVTADQLTYIANEMFSDNPFPTYLEEADWQLIQFRKRMAFMRAGSGPTPSFVRQLEWALSTSNLNPSHPIVMQFQMFLKTHDIVNPQLQGMRTYEREPPLTEPSPAPSPKRRIHSKGRGSADAVSARGNCAGQGPEVQLEGRVHSPDHECANG